MTHTKSYTLPSDRKTLQERLNTLRDIQRAVKGSAVDFDPLAKAVQDGRTIRIIIQVEPKEDTTK